MLRIADPRYLQIAVLTSLCLYASLGVDIGIRHDLALTTFAAALAAQWLGARAIGIDFDWRSVLISCLSLMLLLRTDSLLIAAGAGALAIGSKFLLRWRGRHLFNPSALAIAVFTLAGDGAWIAPGQWGSGALLGLFVAGCGVFVLSRSRRIDISLGFLAVWAAIVIGRGLWLGDPLAIALHSLGNGALLLFAFFMISDPRSTPLSRAGRLLFAVAVAMVAAWLRFALYLPEALVWALVACTPLVPILDALFPGPAHRWRPGLPAAGAHADAPAFHPSRVNP